MPVTPAAERRRGSDWLRAGLLAYGLVVALVAVAHFQREAADGFNFVGVERRLYVPQAIEVLDQGGPPLVAAKRVRLPPIDAPGVYLYLPLFAHAIALDDAEQALKWFLVGLLALVLVAYPLLFYEIFNSLLVAAVAPLILLAHEWHFHERVTEIYWLSAWAILACLPVLLLLYVKPWTRLSVLGLALVGVLASFATSVRGYAGLPIVIVGALVVLLKQPGWGRRAAVLAVLAVAYVSVTGAALDGIERTRDARLGETPRAQKGSPRWHLIYMGLGYLPNDRGIRGGDQMVLRHVRQREPNVAYFSPEYGAAVRSVFLDVLRADPAFVIRTFALKLGRVIRDDIVRIWLTGALALLALLMVRRERAFRAVIPLAAMPLVITVLPAVLSLPAEQYEEGWRATLIVLLLACIGVLVRAAAGWQSVLAGASQRLRSRTDLLGWVPRRRPGVRIARSPAVWGVALACVIAAAFTAGPLAHAIDSAKAEYPYFQFQSALVPTPAVRGETHQLWRFLRPVPTGWRSFGEAGERETACGSVLDLPKLGGDAALHSPSETLPAGRYHAVIRGRVLEGGLGIRVLDAERNIVLAQANYYVGGTAQPSWRNLVMAAVFQVRRATTVSVAIVKWAPKSQASRWAIEEVGLIGKPRDPLGPAPVDGAEPSDARGEPTLISRTVFEGSSLASWSLRRRLPATWTWSGQVAPTIAGTRVLAGIGAPGAPARRGRLVSNEVRLGTGRYQLLVEAAVPTGGLEVEVRDLNCRRSLTKRLFVSDSAQRSRRILTDPFQVKRATRGQVVLTGWTDGRRSSEALVSAVRVEKTEAADLYRSAVLDDRPVAYWRLDDRRQRGPDAPEAALDSSGDNATGNYINGVRLGAPGPFPAGNDASASFDGDDDTLSVPRLELGPRFTIELWIFPRGQGSMGDTAYGTLVGYDTTHRIAWNATAGWVLAQFDGNFVSTKTAPTNSWHHIVYSYDGLTERFYVDGQPAGAHRTGLPEWSSSFRIGDYDGTNYLFNGRLADVAVYNRALPAAAVRRHFSIGCGARCGQPPGEKEVSESS